MSSANESIILGRMRQPVTYRLSIEVRSNAAPEVPSAAAVRAAVEAFKRLLVAVANHMNRELLHSAAWFLPFLKSLPRPRGRPPGTGIVLSVEEIRHAYDTCASELRKRPKRREVATALGVSRSTLYRRLRDENLPFPPARVQLAQSSIY